MRDHGHWPGWHDRGGPPPWWPEGEEFPPRHGRHGPWPRPPARMVRRFLLVVTLFLAVVVASTVGVVLLLVDAFSGRGGTAGALLVVIGGGLLAAVLLGARAARRWAAPLGDVMEAADRVAAGDLDVRVQARGPLPVRRLAASFNAMAARLASHEARRRELLADLAHELRTPLTGVRGVVEAMVDGVRPTDPAQLAVVLERTAAVERLLDDLATLSTAEAGALRLHPESVAPRVLVEDAVEAFAAAASAHGVTLAAEAPDELPSVEADPFRVGQVLGNLVTNALRHTPSGGEVRISAGRGRVGDVPGVVLAVADTGRGVPPDEAAHVFDRFARAADSGGAGLGLPIARSLVEAHGGAIAFASTPGDGTTVRFVLPVDGGAEAAAGSDVGAPGTAQ